MTVKELFEAEKIDKDWLAINLHGESSYYNSCYDFVINNWSEDIDSMSSKQAAWLDKILEDCVEKRIEG